MRVFKSLFNAEWHRPNKKAWNEKDKTLNLNKETKIQSFPRSGPLVTCERSEKNGLPDSFLLNVGGEAFEELGIFSLGHGSEDRRWSPTSRVYCNHAEKTHQEINNHGAARSSEPSSGRMVHCSFYSLCSTMIKTSFFWRYKLQQFCFMSQSPRLKEINGQAQVCFCINNQF